MLAGIEARIATRKGSRVRRPSEKAVMAKPESAKDVVSRMKGRFVLKGPRRPVETTEGGNTVDFNENTDASTSVIDNLPEPDRPVVPTDTNASAPGNAEDLGLSERSRLVERHGLRCSGIL